MGFPGGSVVKNSLPNAGDIGLIPGLEQSLRRKWQPTPVFLPGKSHGQEPGRLQSHVVAKESDTA